MSGQRRALIIGITGQDGAWLAKHLLSHHYAVYGTTRRNPAATGGNLARIGIADQVYMSSANPEAYDDVVQVITHTAPDEIYHLAAQSSVGRSFEEPADTIRNIVLSAVNVLEACRQTLPHARIYYAGSSECFGDTGVTAATEETPFKPRSPYGVGKASACTAVRNYRDTYGLYACTGFTFNHESHLRPQYYVTQKICTAASRIAAGQQQVLYLGDMTIQRDWGWAPEYVDAMWRMLQLPAPNDLVLATGHTHSLSDFVSAAFGHFGLDWTHYVQHDPSLLRLNEIAISRADSSKALEVLGWKAATLVGGVASRMAAHAGSERLDFER